MKNMPEKPKVEEASKTKAVTRVFASTSTVEKSFLYYLQGETCHVEVLYVLGENPNTTCEILCGKQIVLLLLTREPRIPAMSQSKEMHQTRLH